MSAARARPGWVLVCLVIAALAALMAPPAQAHEFRPALLRLTELPASGGPGRYELRLVSPRLSTAGPIAEGELAPIVPEHCAVSPGRLDCGERGLIGELGVAGLERHPVDVMLELRYLDGTRFTAVLGPDEPVVVLDGSEEAGGSVFGEYLVLGVEHILVGIDHLLFVLGLVLLVRDRKTLLWTITAFTLAHSITLSLATLGVVHVPRPPVEAMIALSILLLACEIVRLRHGEPSLTSRWPWAVAFTFGLLHGFGFAGALAELGLPQGDIPLALFSFNVGVEIGQLIFIGAVLGLMASVRRIPIPASWTCQWPTARAPACSRRALNSIPSPGRP